jgi:hypothetical protein
MKLTLSLFLAFAVILAAPLVFSIEVVEVSFEQLVKKPDDYNGKKVKLTCEVIFFGPVKLAVAEIDLKGDENPYKGEAVLLSRVKSSVRKSLDKCKFAKKTCYKGTAEIVGTVKTGEFSKGKYKIKIMIESMEVLSGKSKSGGFKILKKNHRTSEIDSEDRIRRESRQVGRKDGFNPPTYPKYSGGKNLSDGTQILCITDGKNSKAFPIGIMGSHELANIKLGKIPIAVTW